LQHTDRYLCRPIGSTISAAATPEILHHFHSTNETIGAFVTSVFLLGYTFGPIMIAPLSEMYGRAILYKVCATLFVVFNVACAVSNSLGSLIVFRLLAGIVGSCPVTIGTGSIADMIAAEKRAGVLGAYVIGVAFGPSIGPIAGGYLAPAAGWRWCFWLMAIASGVMAIVAIAFIEESYPYVLLKRKTERLRKETGNMDLRSALDTGKTPGDLFAFSILRPLKMLLLPIVFALSLYQAVVYSYLYLCFTTFGMIFGNQYGFSSGEAGLATLGLGVGAVIGVFGYAVASKKISQRLTEKNGGDPRPEYRLPPMIFGAFCTPVGLFWYGWSAETKTHWIVPILGTVFISMGMIFTFVSRFCSWHNHISSPCPQMASTVYLVDIYTAYAASVFGALLPLAGPSMFHALGVGWGNSLLGFIAIAFIPLPFIFYQYGMRLRNSTVFQMEF
jgi:multidrug resistance protein